MEEAELDEGFLSVEIFECEKFGKSIHIICRFVNDGIFKEWE